jgi:hypothetical protein
MSQECWASDSKFKCRISRKILVMERQKRNVQLHIEGLGGIQNHDPSTQVYLFWDFVHRVVF